MNFLQKWILGKELVKQIEEKAFSYHPNSVYSISNGRLITPTDNKNSYITQGYNINDIVYSVVNMILDKVRLPEWSLYKVVDESSLKKANKILSRKDLTVKQYKEALKLKTDSIEPLEKFNLQTGKLNDLLTYPNDDATFQDFITYGSLYKLLTGDVYLWAELLSQGANSGVPNSLWVLPSHLMNIKIKDGFPARPSSYELTTFNLKFRTEEILHEIYANPNWDINGEQLYGFSPLRAFLKNLNRNNSAKDSSAAKFQNGGPDNIIFFDDAKFDGLQGKAQADALRIKLTEEYSGPANVGKTAISGYKMGQIEIGSTPVELGIIDSEKWDAIMFCNGFGVPPELLGLTQKTYNNAKEAQKALITNCAIPLLDSRRNSLNRKIQTDWGFKGVNVYIDYETECFTELQTDINETLSAMSKMTLVTPNEERVAANMDALTEPEADEIWVMQSGSRVPISDFQANEVDESLIDDTQANNENGVPKVPANGQREVGVQNGNGKAKQLTKVI